MHQGDAVLGHVLPAREFGESREHSFSVGAMTRHALDVPDGGQRHRPIAQHLSRLAEFADGILEPVLVLIRAAEPQVGERKIGRDAQGRPKGGDGLPITLTTAANGTGAANFEFRAPTIAAGTLFDVMFRLVDSESTPATELRSGCFTVTVK